MHQAFKIQGLFLKNVEIPVSFISEIASNIICLFPSFYFFFTVCERITLPWISHPSRNSTFETSTRCSKGFLSINSVNSENLYTSTQPPYWICCPFKWLFFKTRQNGQNWLFSTYFYSTSTQITALRTLCVKTWGNWSRKKKAKKPWGKSQTWKPRSYRRNRALKTSNVTSEPCYMTPTHLRFDISGRKPEAQCRNKPPFRNWISELHYVWKKSFTETFLQHEFYFSCTTSALQRK